MNGKWEITDTKNIYENGYLKLEAAEVELPDGNKVDHAIITTPNSPGIATVLAYKPGDGILMVWRHRFITDSWTWELPMGGISQGEKPKDAAQRELLEETGWEATNLEPLVRFQPLPGMTDREIHAFFTTESSWKQDLSDTNEINDIAWLPVDTIETLIDKGDISDGPTLAVLGMARLKRRLD